VQRRAEPHIVDAVTPRLRKIKKKEGSAYKIVRGSALASPFKTHDGRLTSDAVQTLIMTTSLLILHSHFAYYYYYYFFFWRMCVCV
jgi:hypothetical protein